ncbi:hypothetical protein ACULLL_02040 [Lysinibacillus irui]|uniref:hypothetical protein n=1 Tax=Lysinibacillus irui TaxID=2998077 RepID=UPI004043CDC6
MREQIKDIIGRISAKLEAQSQNTTETIIELIYNAQQVNNSLNDSVKEAESMQKVSSGQSLKYNNQRVLKISYA